MPLDQTIDNQRTERFAPRPIGLDSWRWLLPLACFGFLLIATITAAQAQQHDTLPRSEQKIEASAPADQVQMKSWFERLNDAHASDVARTSETLPNGRNEKSLSSTSSPWIPVAFLLMVLISGGVTALQMPWVWQKGLAHHQRDHRQVTLGGKVDAFVGCVFMMLVGMLAVPLLLATAVDLVFWVLRTVTGH